MGLESNTTIKILSYIQKEAGISEQNGKWEVNPATQAISAAINALQRIEEIKTMGLEPNNIEKYALLEQECKKKGFTFYKLQSAMEKQIAKEPIRSKLYALTGITKCPMCRKKLPKFSCQYCKNCGQKIKK